MVLTMACPRCQGDLEYEVERADSGDGVWAMSGWVGYVLWESGEDGCQTACGCTWTPEHIAALDDEATKRAAEGPCD